MSNLLRKGKRLATFQKPRSSFSNVIRARADLLSIFKLRKKSGRNVSKLLGFLPIWRFMGAEGDFGAPIKSSVKALRFISAAAERATASFSDARTANWEGCIESPTPPVLAAFPHIFRVFFMSLKFFSSKSLICNFGCVISGKISDGILYLPIEFSAQNSMCFNSVSALCRHISASLSSAFLRGSFKKLEYEKCRYPTPAFFSARLMQHNPKGKGCFFCVLPVIFKVSQKEIGIDWRKISLIFGRGHPSILWKLSAGILAGKRQVLIGLLPLSAKCGNFQ